MHYSNLSKAIAGTLLSMGLFSNLSFAQMQANATQADPKAGSVSLVGGGSTIVERGTIRYQLQNGTSAAPNDDGIIPVNGATMTIGFPNEYGLEQNVVPVIPNFQVVSYTSGPGGQLELRNSVPLDAGESVNADVPVVGFTQVATFETTTLTVGQAFPIISANTNSGNDVSSADISVTQPLPLTLLAFSAKADACNAVLSWSTAKEENFSHFAVEYAKDGVNFTNVGKVAGGKSNYTFSYAQDNGEGFYKIKIIDRDGTFSESKVVKAITDCSVSNIRVYPNPAKDRINIEGAAVGSTVYVMNITGQTLAAKKVTTSFAQTIEMNGWAAGNYHVMVVNGNEKQVTIIAKQ